MNTSSSQRRAWVSAKYVVAAADVLGASTSVSSASDSVTDEVPTISAWVSLFRARSVSAADSYNVACANCKTLNDNRVDSLQITRGVCEVLKLTVVQIGNAWASPVFCILSRVSMVNSAVVSAELATGTRYVTQV